MKLTYRCKRCDEQLDIELEYKQNIGSEFEDTIEDFDCPYCEYENLIRIKFEVE